MEDNGFFKDIRPELNLEKVNMPENCLYYVNQAFLSTVKNGDIAMYVQNVIIGQLIFAANQPKTFQSIHVYQTKLNYFLVFMI